MLDISLQHKNEASYTFSKKHFCTLPILGLALKGLRKEFVNGQLVIRNSIMYFPEALWCMATETLSSLKIKVRWKDAHILTILKSRR